MLEKGDRRRCRQQGDQVRRQSTGISKEGEAMTESDETSNVVWLGDRLSSRCAMAKLKLVEP
eukprot:scaffold53416_cov46-Cyclotella_meneghiniana.AAC.3